MKEGFLAYLFRDRDINIGRFLAVWLLIFLVLLGVFYFFGPMDAGAKEALLSFAGLRGRGTDKPSSVILLSSRNSENIAAASVSEVWTAPRIAIPNIAVDSPVILSTSRDLDKLNADLLKGVIHYPGSALPGQTGNMVLFGHSSALPTIADDNSYKVFNRLKELKPGNVIDIYSGARKYSYMVTKVELKMADDARIDLETGGKKLLTLSTCSLLGKKELRYVVAAELISS